MFGRWMVKRIILVLSLVVGWSVISLAQDEEGFLSLVYEKPYPGQDISVKKSPAPEVEYSPLFLVEDEFSAEEVKTLGVKTRLKGEKKALSMCYPKIVLKKSEKGSGNSPEQELLFLDKFGKTKKIYKLDPWTEVGWSKNNKYLCLYDIPTTSEDERKVIILDEEGNKLWSYRYCPISGVRVSPKGDYVVEYPDCEYATFAEIWFHSRPGKYKEIRLPSETAAHVDISENGEYFAISSWECLILFDKKGNELWRREGDMLGRPYFLKNEFIGIESHPIVGDEWKSYFFLYDIKGNLLWTNETFLSIEAIYYAEDEGRVYVLSGWGYLFCFEVKSGKLLAQYTEKEAPPFVLSPKAFGEGKPDPAANPLCPNWGGIITNTDCSRIITFDYRGRENYPQRVELFDKDLRKLERKEYPNNYIKYTYGTYQPVMKFSKDNLLSMMTKDGLKVYEVK